MPVQIAVNATYKQLADGTKVPVPGLRGANGITPIPGQDYFTNAEKQQFVQEITDKTKPDLDELGNQIVNQGERIEALENAPDVKSIYVCEYGITKYAQVTKALADGLIPAVFYNSRWYYYSIKRASDYMFTCTGYDISVTHVRVDNADVWNNGSNSAQLAYLRQDTITDSKTNYPSSHAVVQYAERKLPDGWTLKGTMTDPNGINVDLTGCTEIYIVGGVTATATNSHLCFDGAWSTGAITNNGYRKWYIRMADGLFGFETLHSGYGSSENALDISNGMNASMYDSINGKRISDIKRIHMSSPSVITSINFSIYAR